MVVLSIIGCLVWFLLGETGMVLATRMDGDIKVSDIPVVLLGGLLGPYALALFVYFIVVEGKHKDKVIVKGRKSTC